MTSAYGTPDAGTVTYVYDDAGDQVAMTDEFGRKRNTSTMACIG